MRTPAPEFNVEGVWEEALRLYRFEGEQCGISYDHGPLILAYNKNVFNAAGAAYPTLDDLVETSIQHRNIALWGP